MQQDNIRDFAIAAFRAYGHKKDNHILTCEEHDVFTAITWTFRDLQSEKKTIAIMSIKKVYCAIPLGKMRKGTIRHLTSRAASELHADESTIKRGLSRGKRLFNKHYARIVSYKILSEQYK